MELKVLSFYNTIALILRLNFFDSNGATTSVFSTLIGFYIQHFLVSTIWGSSHQMVFIVFIAFVVCSGLLYRYAKFVCNRLKLVVFSPICTLKLHSSYRTHYINHLAAYGAGLLRSKIAVVALLKVNANLWSGFHLEAVESFLCLRYCILSHYWYTSLKKICKGRCRTKTLSPLQNIIFLLQVYFVYRIRFYNWKIFTIIINKFECTVWWNC